MIPRASRWNSAEDREPARAPATAEERSLRWIAASTAALSERSSSELLRQTLLKLETGLPHALLVAGSDRDAGAERLGERHYWLFAIAEQLGVPVLAAPGAADVDPLSELTRTQLDRVRYRLRRFASRAEARETFFARGSEALELSSRSLGGWLRYGAPRGVPSRAGLQLGRLPGDFSLTLAHGGVSVGLLSLNVAFLEFLGDTAEDFVIDAVQLDAACGGSFVEWSRRHDLVVTLSSRPWATPGRVTDEVDRMLRELTVSGTRPLVQVHANINRDAPMLERAALIPSGWSSLLYRVSSLQGGVRTEHEVPTLRELDRRAEGALLRHLQSELLRELQTRPIARHRAEALVRDVLPDPIALDRFLGRRFPDVARRVWPGHSYDDRLDLLLGAHSSREVAEAIVTEEPRRVIRRGPTL